MARQPASNEEALVKLGSEKLARLVIGEAKRNAAFRKLVAAALAATKGPAAVAAISPSAAKRRYSLGYPIRRFDIGVVEWNPMDCLDREFCAIGHELRRRTKQRGI